MRIALLLFLVACDVKVTTPVNVDVNCEAKSEGVDCTAKQTIGTSEAEACWEFVITCETGTVRTPKMCAKVKDGGTTTATMPRDKLIGADTCKGDRTKTTAKVENFTIDGKVPDSVTPTKNN
jgi:hypothetical protein